MIATTAKRNPSRSAGSSSPARFLLTRSLRRALVLCLSTAWLSACASSEAPRSPASQLDRVAVHVARGEEALLNGQPDVAQRAFALALSLEPRSSTAWAGQAVWLAQTGKTAAALDACDEAETAAETPPQQRQAHVARLRVLSLAQPDDDWLDEAQTNYEEARTIAIPAEAPTYAAPQFFMARAFRRAFRLVEAGTLYQEVVSGGGFYANRADREWQETQQIARAAPTSALGRQLAFAPSITRADIAALLRTEFDLEAVYTRTRRQQPRAFQTADANDPRQGGRSEPRSARGIPVGRSTRDIAEHPLADDIHTVLRLQVAGLAPSADGRFYPDALLTRGEFALISEDLLAHLNGNLQLRTAFIGQPSPFTDVRSSLHIFNAVMTVTTKGLLPPLDPLRSRFAPQEPVRGSQVLLTLHQLKNLARSGSR